MTLKVFTSNTTDTELDGKRCIPDISVNFNGISAARSHGPRYRGMLVEQPVTYSSDGTPAKERPPVTMPSGDVVFAATGIGGEHFSASRAEQFLLSSTSKMGQETMTEIGGATFGMLVKASDAVKMLIAGDCIISIIGTDKEGKPKVSQLTFDRIGTLVEKAPIPGALQAEDGSYAPQDMREIVHACPDSHIGFGFYHPSSADIITLSYDKVAAEYGENAIFVVATDGLYDGVIHPDYLHFENEQEQAKYLAELAEDLHARHEEFLRQVVHKLHENNYRHTDHDYAQVLTRFVRNHNTQLSEVVQRCSQDDIGIICISAAKPKTPDEHAAVMVLDAIGSTKLKGVETARFGAETALEYTEKYTPNTIPALVTGQPFKHDSFVRERIDCKLKYRNTSHGDRIVFEFTEPSFTGSMRTKYDSMLADIPKIFGADIVAPIMNEVTGRTKAQILLPPEKADQAVHIEYFLTMNLLGNTCELNMRHDNSLNELAASEFLRVTIHPDSTRQLQDMLRRTQPREVG